MNFEKIDIKDIVPADYNPRILDSKEYDKLSRSIKEFSLVDPIIINTNNNKIIGGHQRYKVLYDEYIANPSKYQELSLIRLGDIGWVFLDNEISVKSESDEKALNVALNKISGRWDMEKLSTLFVDLDTEGFDSTLTGFEDFEIELLVEGDLESLDLDNYDDEYGVPDDFMDVQGDKANKSYVVSIGFDNQEIANKFLDYIDYHRHMTRDTLQFMFTELEWDLDALMQEKEYLQNNKK